MQPAMATPQNKRPASLFSKLRTLTRLTRTSAKVAPAGLAAALETAGAEALELLPATLHTNDAAAAKRWARRVTERHDRPRAKTFEEDEVRKLPTSPTHWGRTTSDAQDDIVLVSPDFSMTKSRFEVPDLHLGRLSPMKPSLMSPLGSTTRFSARLTQRTQRGSARSTTRYNDGSTHRLATARSKAEVVSSSNFAAFAALDGEGACLACMNDAAWRRRVCAPPLDSKSLEVLRATCAALRGDEEDDAAFAFEAFCAAVSARAPVDDAVALATRTGDTLMYATDRLRALDPDAVKERALLCAFLKAADVNAAQLACEVLRSGRGRRSVPVCRAALELVESIDEETALALTRHVDACLADDDAEAQFEAPNEASAAVRVESPTDVHGRVDDRDRRQVPPRRSARRTGTRREYTLTILEHGLVREHAALDERREDRSVRCVHPRPERVVLDQHRVAVQQAAPEHLHERKACKARRAPARSFEIEAVAPKASQRFGVLPAVAYRHLLAVRDYAERRDERAVLHARQPCNAPRAPQRLGVDVALGRLELVHK